MKGRAESSMGGSKVPDAIYDINRAHTSLSKTHHSGLRFDTQVPRDTSSRTVNGVLELDTSNLENLKFKKIAQNVTSFKEHTSRSRLVTNPPIPKPKIKNSQGEWDSDSYGSNNDEDIIRSVFPANSTSSHVKGYVTFGKKCGRDNMRSNGLDLIYDIDSNVYNHKTGVVDFNRTLPRKDINDGLEESPITDLNPSSPTRKLVRSISFGSMVGRHTKVARSQYMDAEYNTNRPINVKGVLSMNHALGRETKKPGKADLGYQSQIQLSDSSDLLKLKPRTYGALSFDKTTSRTQVVRRR
eukprot:PhF_6_TR28167/c0_g1_i1/m.41733